MKVLIVGAGALGSLLGALLRESLHEPFLVARPDATRAITLDGLRLTGGGYGPARRVPLVAGPAPPPSFRPDLVILAVKTQDVERALDEHAGSFGDAPVVALQNGLAQDPLVEAAVGRERAVAAIAALDAQSIEPGRVDCARAGTLVLSRAVPALGDAVRVKIAADPRDARWTKLLVNLGNAIPAITGLSFQEAARHEGLARAHVRMIREGVAVADAEGVTLAPLPWTSPALLRLTARAPEAMAARIYALRVRRVLGRAPAYGSTWQSVQRGASVETPWLNGEIARRGAARGIATPANVAAVALVEKGETLTADEAASVLLSG